jgi:hypothetical protein
LAIGREEGDSLEGERIVCECRKLNGAKLTRIAQGHRGTRVIMTQYVYCVIEKPLIRKS